MKTGTLISLTASLLAMALICSGCGGVATLNVDPMSLFEQGKQGLRDTSSVQMDISCAYRMEFGEAASREMKKSFGDLEKLMNIDMKLQSEKTADGLWIILFSIRTAGASSSRSSSEMTMYMVGDRIFVKNGRSGWYYYESQGMGDFQSSYQGMTPENVEKMMENSDSVEITGESHDSIDYCLVLGRRYLDFMMQQMNGIDDPLLQAGAEKIRSATKLYENSELYITINKESGLPTAGKLTLRIELPEFIKIIDPEMQDEETASLIEEGQGSYMIIDFAISFSDYGKGFGIALPEEAANAEPLPVSSQ